MPESIGIRPAPQDSSFVYPSSPKYDGATYFNTLAYDVLYHSPVGVFGIGGGPKGGIQRASELFLEKRDESSDVISAEMANDMYGIEEELNFNEPIRMRAARLIHERKTAELRGHQIIGADTNTWGRKVGSFPVSLAVAMLDPVNLATAFIPVVGQSRYLRGIEGTTKLSRMVQRGVISPKTVQRLTKGSPVATGLLRGAAEGGIGFAAIEPLSAIPEVYEKGDYDVFMFAEGILFGGALGGVLGSTAGVMARISRATKNASSRTHEAALLGAVKDLAEDKPIRSPGITLMSDEKVVTHLIGATHSKNVILIASDFVARLDALEASGRVLSPELVKKREALKYFLDSDRRSEKKIIRSMARWLGLEVDDTARNMPPMYQHLDPAEVDIEMPRIMRELRALDETGVDEVTGEVGGLVDAGDMSYDQWRQATQRIYGHNGDVKFKKIDDLSDTKRGRGEPKHNVIVMVGATINGEMVGAWSVGHMRFSDGGHFLKGGKWLKGGKVTAAKAKGEQPKSVLEQMKSFFRGGEFWATDLEPIPTLAKVRNKSWNAALFTKEFFEKNVKSLLGDDLTWKISGEDYEDFITVYRKGDETSFKKALDGLESAHHTEVARQLGFTREELVALHKVGIGGDYPNPEKLTGFKDQGESVVPKEQADFDASTEGRIKQLETVLLAEELLEDLWSAVPKDSRGVFIKDSPEFRKVEELSKTLTKAHEELDELKSKSPGDVGTPVKNPGPTKPVPSPAQVAKQVSKKSLDDAQKEGAKRAEPKPKSKKKTLPKKDKSEKSAKRSAVSENNADVPVKTEPDDTVRSAGDESTEDTATLREDIRALEQELGIKADAKEGEVPQFEMGFVKQLLDEVVKDTEQAAKIRKALDTAKPCIKKKKM